jgi:hypothetical protein
MRTRLKSWIPKIRLILLHLESNPQPAYTCQEIAALFGVGRSQAADLMKVVGLATGNEIQNGLKGYVTRESLRWYLEGCPEAVEFLRHEQRRKEMWGLLTKEPDTPEDLRQKAIPIAAQHSDEWTRWEDLPAVKLGRGQILIRCKDENDATRTVYRMCKAIANEPDQFARALRGRKRLSRKTALIVQSNGDFSKEDLDRILTPATPEERERLKKDP